MGSLDRLKLMLNDNDINKLVKANVLLVGVGGVGGSALEMLIRSGINNITIIDFDVFEESNLNRQILCTRSDIGKYKVDVAKERCLSINPNLNIKIINRKLDDYLINELSYYDYIIDACDDLNAKILLVKYALDNNIKIVSSCGTGNRLDPSKLYITNIWKTENDPLAKKFRSLLRKEKISYKLPVVTSKETPLIKGTIVASIATVPNTAGIYLANYVIKDIINK